MFEQADHYEFMEELRFNAPYPGSEETGEDELLDEIRRAEDEDNDNE